MWHHLPPVEVPVWPLVPVPSESVRLVDGEFTPSTTTKMVTVTTAATVAVLERSTLVGALVAAVAIGTVLETSILEPFVEAFRRAHSGGHVGGGESITVEGTRAGVIAVATLVDVFLAIVPAAGSSGVRGVGRGRGRILIEGVDVNAVFVTTGLGRVTGTCLVALREIGKVGVDEVIAAVAFFAPLHTSKAIVL